MSRRNHQIDGLRGIAILLIVLFHFFYRYFQLFAPGQGNDILSLSTWESFGICVFLVITGVFIVDDQNQGKFIFPMLKRVLRLWPVYLLCITMIFIAISFFPLPGRTQSFKTYLINATMLNGFVGTAYVDSAHWYLTTLLAVNFVSLLIHKCKLQNKMTAYYAWMAAICFLTYAKTMIPASSLQTKAISGAITLLGGGWVGTVISGIALMQISKDVEKEKLGREWTLLLTSLVYVHMMNDATILFLTIIALTLVWLALGEKLWFLQNRAIVSLGNISYSVYLIHQNIGYALMYYGIKRFGIHPNVAGLAAFFATLLLGFCIYHFYERPVLYFTKKALRKAQRAIKMMRS